ncbi:RSP_7527 family protein [Rhodovulum sp. YNF3179]|jgi:hypothetical protein|uniref:RSP_7527 family protein n=1 Tax=Rhodovulum sp. YNF3179 TaxID=3425127 RepID=UPI003D357A1A
MQQHIDYSALDIQAIEQDAHRLRAEAMAEGLRRIRRFLSRGIGSAARAGA